MLQITHKKAVYDFIHHKQLFVIFLFILRALLFYYIYGKEQRRHCPFIKKHVRYKYIYYVTNKCVLVSLGISIYYYSVSGASKG